MDPSSTRSFRTSGEEDTLFAGERLAGLAEEGDVIALCGDLGAGKTALVRGIARGLGVEAPVTSPTFNILVVHSGRLTLNHFDLYRLERADQLEDIGFYETLESDGVSAIEWGDRFPGELPADHLEVTICIGDDDSRVFSLVPSGPRSSVLAEAWADAMGES